MQMRIFTHWINCKMQGQQNFHMHCKRLSTGCHPHPAAGFISWAQRERRLGFVLQMQVSVTGFTACCCVPVPAWARACERSCLLPCQSPYSCFSCFLYLLFIFQFVDYRATVQTQLISRLVKFSVSTQLKFMFVTKSEQRAGGVWHSV